MYIIYPLSTWIDNEVAHSTSQATAGQLCYNFDSGEACDQGYSVQFGSGLKPDVSVLAAIEAISSAEMFGTETPGIGVPIGIAVSKGRISSLGLPLSRRSAIFAIRSLSL